MNLTPRLLRHALASESHADENEMGRLMERFSSSSESQAPISS